MSEMFGVEVAPLTLEQATEKVIDFAILREKGLVVTPNVDHIVTLHQDNAFREIYMHAKLIVADGMPLVWLSKLLAGESLPERVTGSDLLETVCESASLKGLSVAFIGGMPGVAMQAKEKLCERYPSLNIVGVVSPNFGFEHNKEESDKIIAMVNAWSPDIVFIGVGAPKQEKWSFEHLDELNCGPILCTGAAFDFSAGICMRAPQWMQSTGLEWTWRMFQDPRRLIKRYLVRDIRFILYALREVCKALVDRVLTRK